MYCIKGVVGKGRRDLFHIHSFSNEKKVQRVLKKYPCFFNVCKSVKKKVDPSLFQSLVFVLV